MTELRQVTRTCHDRLEEGLGLLSNGANPQWLGQVLERFYGFHAVWEPAMADALEDEALFGPRRRKTLLERDLKALGRSADELDRLCRCGAAAALARTPFGSLYVMEGSTLGGQIIARHLAKGPRPMTAPPRYFNPYGSATGAMWRSLQQRLRDEAATERGRTAILEGAIDTFQVLHDWLRPVFGRSHERAA
jgi:heme oxygenase